MIKCLRQPKSPDQDDHVKFKDLKKVIFMHLSTYIVDQIQADSPIADKIMGRFKNVNELFRTVPELLEIILNKIRNNECGNRRLLGGQYLKKTIIGENVIWVNTKNRPSDVMTLLRFCLLYRLVRKNQLFVRTFMSKDEQHIMLVIKTSE